MTDRKATAYELAQDAREARRLEYQSYEKLVAAVEYRVRTEINLDLALEREEDDA